MRPEDLTGRKILYGCLDWGNGHVARSIPLIRQLLKQGNEVIVWCSEQQRSIFEAAQLAVSYHCGFEQDFHFTGDGNFKKELLRNAFSFRRAIKDEQKAVTEFARENHIDSIISDHRYGLRSDSVPSVFVTHQVQLPPKSGRIAQWIHRKWMQRFDHTWIMDHEHNGLAGDLSATENGLYIDHYSRFTAAEVPAEEKGIVAVISGPEPYAEQLYMLLVSVAQKSGGDWTFICPKDYSIRHDFPVIRDWKAADTAILNAKLVVSRNGYSTLMDLSALGKKAVLIPTPGQLEQTYLAAVHRAHPLWRIAENETALEQLLSEIYQII